MVAITEGDLLGLASVYIYVGVVVAVVGLLADRLSEPRKVLHILTGGIVFLWWTFDTREVMAGLAAFPFVVILLLSSPKSPVSALRKGYLGVITEEGHAHGLIMYAISWTIIAYAMFDHLLAASIAIGAMAFGDGMGGIIGRRFGRIEYLKNRTLEGTAAVFITMTLTVIVLVWFYCDVVGTSSVRPEDPLLFALAVAALVSVVEGAIPGKIDNLIVPLTVGAYLAMLGV